MVLEPCNPLGSSPHGVPAYEKGIFADIGLFGQGLSDVSPSWVLFSF